MPKLYDDGKGGAIYLIPNYSTRWDSVQEYMDAMIHDQFSDYPLETEQQDD